MVVKTSPMDLASDLLHPKPPCVSDDELPELVAAVRAGLAADLAHVSDANIVKHLRWKPEPARVLKVMRAQVGNPSL